MIKTGEVPAQRGLRLEQLRKLAGLSRYDLSKLSGNGASTLQYWEKGQAKGIPVYEAERLVQIFNKIGVKCSISWLLHGEDDEPILLSQFNLHFEDDATIDKALIEEVKFFQLHHSDCIIFKIEDDAMLPFYNSGDIVGGDKRYGDDIINIVNRNCIVELSSGECICRYLRVTDKKKHYNLLSLNINAASPSATVLETRVNWAAEVIWHRKEIK